MKNKIRNFLSQPYPFASDLKTAVLFALVITAIVTFLIILGSSAFLSTDYAYLIIAGYSAITFLTSLIFLTVPAKIFPKYFNEETWIVKKEILSVIFIVFLIGNFNFFFALFITTEEATIIYYYLTIVHTFIIAIVPFLLSIFIGLNLTLKKQLEEVKQLNIELAKRKSDFNDDIIHFESENKNEFYKTKSSNILHIQSAQNYIEIFEDKKESKKPTLLRNTLKNIEELLKTNPTFFRCHRAYIVNLSKIEMVDGNSQGYLLKLKGSDSSIPVSRSYTKNFKQAINNLPN